MRNYIRNSQIFNIKIFIAYWFISHLTIDKSITRVCTHKCYTFVDMVTILIFIIIQFIHYIIIFLVKMWQDNEVRFDVSYT